MSEDNQKSFELARQIALEVMTRRDAGAHITDEEVLAKHQHLRDDLAEHLSRLRNLRHARTHISHNPPESSSEHERDDARLFDEPLDPPEEEDEEGLRVTTLVEPAESPIDGQTTDGAAGFSAEFDEENPAQLAPTQVYRPTNRPPMAMVKLFLDGSQTFLPVPVFSDNFVIGRTEGDLRIPHDPRISARHASIQRRRHGETYVWYLVDLESTNGTFVRIDHAVLKPDDQLLIGTERYRFIQRDGRFGLARGAGHGGDTWFLGSNVNWIGREAEDAIPCMRADPYLDPNHAIVRLKSGRHWVIINNDSMNGVWYAIRETPLSVNCSFQVGEQRIGFQTR